MILKKFFPLIKVDEAAHMVWGVVTSETPDSDGEICDYSEAKLEIKKWSDETLAKTTAAGQDPSLGNMRVMHQLQVGGKAIKIDYRDDSKQIWVGSEPANDEVWHLLKGGFLTAHSIGGSYKWRRQEGEYKRYAPTIGEISYVDKGSNPDASFSYVKADGSTELRKFATPGSAELALLAKLKASELHKLSEADIDRIVKGVVDSMAKGVKYLVPEGQHLPYTDESGKPNHRLMGAAWAALHGGYRGNKYEGPGKEQAIAHLKQIYHSEGMEPPSEKAIGVLADLQKQITESGVELGTEFQKIRALIDETMGKLSAATGDDHMKLTAEQLKKMAAALGISEDELSKNIAETVILPDALAKARGGLAALHGHMEKAMEHHDGMMKAHTAMAAMHEKHSAHLEKCMKACKAVMGEDDKEAEKALKALLSDLGVKDAPVADPPKKDEPKTGDAITKADMEAILTKQREEFEKKLGELPKPDPAGLRVVPRASAEEVRKAQETGIPEAIPV